MIALPSYFDHYALGMGLAVLSIWLERRPCLPAVLRPVERFPGLCWALAGGAFVLVSVGIGIPRDFFATVRPHVYFERHLLEGVIAMAMVLPVVVGDQSRGLLGKALANRALLWVGMASYSVFLWNLVVLGLLAQWGWSSVDLVHPYITWGE